MSAAVARRALADGALVRCSTSRGRDVLAAHPLGRIGTPEEIANVVCSVASDEASFMTGSELYVVGGLSARFAS